MSGTEPPPTVVNVFTRALAVSPGAVVGIPDTLYLVDTDGTIWRLVVQIDHDWKQLPSLPAPSGTAVTTVPVP